MPARAATAVRTQQKSQRELEDLQLVMRVHNGDERARETLIQRYTGFVRMKASSYFIAGGEPRGPGAGGPDRPLQGDARLPRRQGDVVPLVRRAVRDAADHHGDQDRDALQARAAEHLRVVLADAGRPGSRFGRARSATRSPART